MHPSLRSQIPKMKIGHAGRSSIENIISLTVQRSEGAQHDNCEHLQPIVLKQIVGFQTAAGPPTRKLDEAWKASTGRVVDL